MLIKNDKIIKMTFYILSIIHIVTDVLYQAAVTGTAAEDVRFINGAIRHQAAAHQVVAGCHRVAAAVAADLALVSTDHPGQTTEVAAGPTIGRLITRRTEVEGSMTGMAAGPHPEARAWEAAVVAVV